MIHQDRSRELKKAKTNIQKNEVSIAKNYLDENEMKLLGLLVSDFLDTSSLQGREGCLVL